MSTNASISRVLPDGSVHTIYSHWDGYIDGVGLTLFKHYTDADKIVQLIELGDVSCLDKSLDKPEGHDFDNKVEGCSVFYMRDRNAEGDHNSVRRLYADIDDLFEKNYDVQAYNYVYHAGKWLVSCFETDDILLPLEKYIHDFHK
jgi:hypothetical protein